MSGGRWEVEISSNRTERKACNSWKEGAKHVIRAFYIFVYIDTLNIKLHGCRRWPVAELVLARGRNYDLAVGPTSVCLLPQFVRQLPSNLHFSNPLSV